MASVQIDMSTKEPKKNSVRFTGARRGNIVDFYVPNSILAEIGNPTDIVITIAPAPTTR